MVNIYLMSQERYIIVKDSSHLMPKKDKSYLVVITNRIDVDIFKHILMYLKAVSDITEDIIKMEA